MSLGGVSAGGGVKAGRHGRQARGQSSRLHLNICKFESTGCFQGDTLLWQIENSYFKAKPACSHSQRVKTGCLVISPTRPGQEGLRVVRWVIHRPG